MKKILESIKLHYKDSKSDKVYNIFLYELENSPGYYYSVETDYGRRNTFLKRIIKLETDSKRTAQGEYEKIKHEKLNKGYKISFETDSLKEKNPSKTQKALTDFLKQDLTDTTPAESFLEKFFKSL